MNESGGPREHGKRKFTNEEDSKIMSMVNEKGIKSWKEIAASLKNRTARQCRERWKHYLSQEIEKAPWSAQEDSILDTKFAEFGPKWSLIAKSLPGRTDVNIKNRWALLCRKRTKKSSLLRPKHEIKQQNHVQQTKTKHLNPIPPVRISNVNPPQLVITPNIEENEPWVQKDNTFFNDSNTIFCTDITQIDQSLIADHQSPQKAPFLKDELNIFDQFLKDIEKIQNKTNEEVNDDLFSVFHV